MTDLRTKTAQSLHAEWCEQMREKGFYGLTDPIGGYESHRKFHPDLIPWPDLPESRRQEYLATAKAVLPEIVGEVFEDAAKNLRSISDEMFKNGESGYLTVLGAGVMTRQLRDRRLEELK